MKLRENKADAKNFWATVTLSEGKNREIRKIMEYFGCQVSRLIRTDYGPFKLGNLPSGKFCRVPEKEVLKLRHAIFSNDA
jgi:23S rRNA pseudouridine2605 synthase